MKKVSIKLVIFNNKFDLYIWIGVDEMVQTQLAVFQLQFENQLKEISL